MPQTGKPLILMIIDGWGHNPEREGNAVLSAKLPNLNKLTDTYPNTLLKASGTAVGLPAGQMGNSEVGHLNIGTGRIVYQELTRIFKSIEDGRLFSNQVLLTAMHRLKNTGKALHLMGLLSDGGVHSHIKHLFALLDMAVKEGVENIFVHPILDGRDVLPQSAKGYVIQLENKLRELGKGRIATIGGRYYAMDRDRRWDRVEKAYNVFVSGQGPMEAHALAAVERSYDTKTVDEFIQPTVLGSEGKPLATINDGDSVIFFNFRADRARQITRAFVEEEFKGFSRNYRPAVHYVCFTEYDATINCPVAFPPQNLENTLGEVLADNGMKQLRIAETEKYAHVTFFFNGGIEEPNEGEDRLLIPSPKVPTYNMKPEMSAYEVTEALLEKINKEKYDVVILNYANPDMVGHTGEFEAAVKALETVDECAGKIVAEARLRDGTVLITSDHGNSERMFDTATNSPFTAHTTNQVPFILVNEEYKNRKLRQGGFLCDIAPTLLDILGLGIPKEMTGKSLLKK